MDIFNKLHKATEYNERYVKHCEGINRDGVRCSNSALIGYQYCRMHLLSKDVRQKNKETLMARMSRLANQGYKELAPYIFEHEKHLARELEDVDYLKEQLMINRVILHRLYQARTDRDQGKDLGFTVTEIIKKETEGSGTEITTKQVARHQNIDELILKKENQIRTTLETIRSLSDAPNFEDFMQQRDEFLQSEEISKDEALKIGTDGCSDNDGSNVDSSSDNDYPGFHNNVGYVGTIGDSDG
jgi:hypothetical protein